MIHQAFIGIAAQAVGRAAVLSQFKGRSDGVFRRLIGNVVQADLPVYRGQFFSDLLLLGFKKF